MPTVHQFFQPPLLWQQFEELSKDLLAEVYSIPNAQLVGRPGQSQDGVDVHGTSTKYGEIGVQCKRLSDLDENNDPLPGGRITEKFLETAAKEAMGFNPTLAIWILATTAKRDKNTQRFVGQLNEKWKNEGIPRLAIVWSWDDCISYLNSFPELQRKYYQEVINVNGPNELDLIILDTVAMAFNRPAFQVPIHCETSGEFRSALKDTQRVLNTGELVDRESRLVIRKSIGGWSAISNETWKSELREVANELRLLRSALDEGIKNGNICENNSFLEITDQNLIIKLESHRASCVQRINNLVSIR